MRRLYLIVGAVLVSGVPLYAQGSALKLKTYTNSLKMKFVLILPGTFQMGSPKTEQDREPFESDESQHKVKLTRAIYMGVYTVTQAEWNAVMKFNPSQFKGESTLPLEGLTWHECGDFCEKLTEKDGKPYRLPTEAEWEYCCRAGTTTPFHFGEQISTDQANFNGKGTYRKKPLPVGSFPANAWGLYDMHGNVWQWCQDWYGPYPEKEVTDPRGPEKGEKRVLRGGGWNNDSCRSAMRHRTEPGRISSNIGFRICFDAD